MYVICRVLFDVFDVRCVLLGVCYLFVCLFVVCWLLIAVCCVVCVCRVSLVDYWLFVVS